VSQKTERLVNLTIALLETRRPLSLVELQHKTGYYSDQDHDSARRMFERDKDDLRRMGVPVDTLPIPHSAERGYSINRKQYELADPAFTRDEITALALAQQHAGSSDVGLAFAKITARAPDPDSTVSAVTFGLRVTDSLYPPDVLATAVIERSTVAFNYQTPHTTASIRTVNPYALARRRGRWYLVGFDHARTGIRAYRIDRIDGAINTVSLAGAFPAPEHLDLAQELLPPAEELITVSGHVSPLFVSNITARGGTVTTAKSHPNDETWPTFTLAGVDVIRDLPWLLGFGDQVRIIEPLSIVSSLTETFRLLATSHQVDV